MAASSDKKSPGDVATLTVGITTWNVGNEEPFHGDHANELPLLLPMAGKDVFALGVQECTYKIGEHRVAPVDSGEGTSSSATPPPDEDDKLNIKVDDDFSLEDEDENRKEDDIPGLSSSTHHHMREKMGKLTRFQRASQAHFDSLIMAHAAAEGHELVELIVVVQMRLYIFARPEVKARISRVKKVYENVGKFHVGANKAGLLVSLVLDNSTVISFISCHLNAHSHRLKRRISDCCEIMRYARTASRYVNQDLASDFTFFFGDLNFRLDLITKYEMNEWPSHDLADTKHESYAKHRDSVLESIDNADFPLLSRHDQLNYVLSRRLALSGFLEAPLTFPPTFKVKRHRNVVDEGGNVAEHVHYQSKRIASWTDRILFKTQRPDSLVGGAQPIEVEEYVHVPECSTSDHKPVRGTFRLQLPAPNGRLGGLLERFVQSGTALDPPTMPLLVVFDYINMTHLAEQPSIFAPVALTDVDPMLVFWLLPVQLKGHSRNAGRTRVRLDTHSPQWGHDDIPPIRIAAPMDLADVFRIVVQAYDKDFLKRDDDLGHVVLRLVDLTSKEPDSATGLRTIEVKDANMVRSGELLPARVSFKATLMTPSSPEYGAEIKRMGQRGKCCAIQ